MNSKALFVETVRATKSLPALAREHVDEITDLRETQFDESYIEFLDTQIRLCPRGPVWNERLKRRRAALQPFTGITLLDGTVRVAETHFWIKIHPGAKTVVHWEQYCIRDGQIIEEDFDGIK